MIIKHRCDIKLLAYTYTLQGDGIVVATAERLFSHAIGSLYRRRRRRRMTSNIISEYTRDRLLPLCHIVVTYIYRVLCGRLVDIPRDVFLF
ncbi:hypothetical protein TSAR_010056 [Trichomalopsis sarcophagae]|uniref:Uncharacterized protein n=1 Tax=Trichomalopsis sarcophagae TaxID=543379 RepID=A0A232FA08_9HYME|nr:hypothetical protein TSAR_010056 [Trichomalopsis sarcophagae]